MNKKYIIKHTNTVRASGIHLNSKQLPLGKKRFDCEDVCGGRLLRCFKEMSPSVESPKKPSVDQSSEHVRHAAATAYDLVKSLIYGYFFPVSLHRARQRRL